MRGVLAQNFPVIECGIGGERHQVNGFAEAADPVLNLRHPARALRRAY